MKDTTKTRDTQVTNPRDLDDVLMEMIQAVPQDAEGRELIIRRFNKHKDDLLYTAPELTCYQWRRVGESLEQFFGRDTLNEWQENIIKIFTNK